MKLSWKIFKAYLFSKRSGSAIKTISRISIFNVAVGIMSFVVVFSVMSGFRDSLTQRFFQIEPHIVTESQFQPEVLKSIQKIPNVKKVVRYSKSDIILRTTDGQFSGALLKGYEQNFLFELLENLYGSQLKKVGKVSKKQGRYTALKREKEYILSVVKNMKPNEVVLGSYLADKLNLLQGDKILIIPPETLLMPAGEIPQFIKMTVAGTFTSNVPDVDSQYVFYRFYNQRDEFKDHMSQKGGAEIWLKEPYKYESVQSKISKMGIFSQSWKQRNENLFYAITLEKYTIGAFLFLAGLITFMSIVSVIVLILLQKQNDIGILLTLGLSKKRVQRIFTQLGVFLSFLGIFLGLILGISICLFLYFVPMDVLSKIYYDTTIPVRIEVGVLFGIFIIASLISFFVSWLPTQKMSEISPVNSLRK